MVRLRPAEPQDEWLFWELRREIQPDLLREEHVKWWNEVWEHRFVAYDGPAMVGVIRISPQLAGVGTLHYQVARKERNKGFGTQMLETISRVARLAGFTRLVATVLPGNVPSQRAFEGAGYEPTRYEVSL